VLFYHAARARTVTDGLQKIDRLINFVWGFCGFGPGFGGLAAGRLPAYQSEQAEVADFDDSFACEETDEYHFE
jgi:hypothetical protein